LSDLINPNAFLQSQAGFTSSIFDTDKSFKDTLIDVIYDNLILLLQEQSHDISFPELVLPLVIRVGTQ
jgi:hypothetical protein